MKTVLIAVLLSLASVAPAGVQDDIKTLQKSTVCVSVNGAQDQIINNHKESVLFRGLTHGETSALVLTFNEYNKTWTVMLYDKTEACLLAYGTEGDAVQLTQVFQRVQSTNK